MMLQDALVAYLHFAAILTLVWFLAKEWTLLKAGAANLDIQRLARADTGFGIAAVAVIATGVARVTLGAKPLAFYTTNPTFHVKISLFVLVGIVSIGPTIAFLRWRKAARADPNFRVPEQQWRRVKRFVIMELHGLALIPIFAVLMARGFRLFG
jgi:putative membrane protein